MSSAVDTAGTYTIRTDTEINGVGWDGYLFLYSSFDPSTPLLGGIDGNDDDQIPNQGICAGNTSIFHCSVVSGDLATGTTYYIVQTGSLSSSAGLYDGEIIGDGTATIGERTTVPSPLPLFGAAAAFGCSRKLRKRIKDSKQAVAIG